MKGVFNTFWNKFKETEAISKLDSDSQAKFANRMIPFIKPYMSEYLEDDFIT